MFTSAVMPFRRRLAVAAAALLASAALGLSGPPGAEVPAANASHTGWVSDWDSFDNWKFQYYPSWGYLTSSSSGSVAWTHPYGKTTGTIHSGSAYARSTKYSGCLRVKVTGYYLNIGWKQVGGSTDSDGFYTRCGGYTSSMSLQGIQMSGWTMLGMNIKTCWSRYAGWAPINCDSETIWDGGS